MFFRERGQLTLQEKGGIVALHSHGVSRSAIANTFNCHRNTVNRWIQRYEETLDVHRRIGSGRPKLTTPEEDSMFLDAVRAKPITTAQEILGSRLIKEILNRLLTSFVYFRYYWNQCEQIHS